MSFRWWRAAAAPAVQVAAGAVPTLAELVALRERAAERKVRRIGSAGAAPGSQHSRQLGRGLEFAEVRPYQRGDDVRSIDWRHTARRGRPCTKVFHDERDAPLLLLVDIGPSMRFGTRVAFKSVVASRAAALLAWAAVDDGERVGGIVCGADGHHFVPTQRQPRGAFALIRALTAGHSEPPASASVAATGRTTDLAAALRALARAANCGSHAVVLSDFRSLDAEARVELMRLAGRNPVTLVQVFDAIEAEPPPAGLYRIADAHGERILDLRRQAARAAYGEAFRNRSATLATLARRVGAALIPLATGDDPMRVLHAVADRSVIRGSTPTTSPQRLRVTR